MKTQNEQVKKALLSGEKLTRIEALRDYGISRLAARVNDISGQIEIQRGWRTVRTRWADTTTRIRLYWTDERAA